MAKTFGGSGELDNLVVMDKIVNRSDYRIMENQ
ncbi:DNA/RNA non-specific endonuclease [Veillonella sp. DNF00869]